MDSSLDRFIRERSVQLFGLNWSSRGAFIALAINAVAHSTVGGVLTAIALENPARGLSLVGSILLSVGVACAIGSWFAWRKVKASVRSESRLTAEGQRLVMKLANHVGWSSWSQTGSWSSSPGGNWTMGKRTCSQVMTDSGFELLDAAAAQYNRVSGLLQIQGAIHSPSIEKMRPAIRAAMDDTMIGVINQVALLDVSPETAAAIHHQVIHDVGVMKELGDRIEAIRAQTPTLTERLSSSSPILDVIEQLKLDEAARSELHGDDSELRNRG